MGDSANAKKLEDRANNWVNVFNTSTGLLTPRLQSGAFLSGITPSTGSHYIEGTAAEYLWDVPNNYAGLFSLLGGNAKVKPALRKFLSRPDGYGEYAQLSNEFGSGEEYAPDYAGDPAGAQQAVNTLRYGLYLPGPSGLPDNDDLGANSSAFVWAMLGMFPENPGSDTLVFGSPGFPHATVSLPSGKTDQDQRAGCVGVYVLREVSEDQRPVQQQAVRAVLDPRQGFDDGLDDELVGDVVGHGCLERAAVVRPDIPGSRRGEPVVPDPAAGGVGQDELTVKVSSSDAAQTVQWKATAPSGITVTPSSGTLNVPAGGSASADVTVAAGDTDGNYPVTFTLTGASGRILPASLSVIVARPVTCLRSRTTRVSGRQRSIVCQL